jgi:N-acetylglucosamine malate deacetylase 2
MSSDMWSEGDRIVVVAAHPDDETIGMGGQLASIGDVTLTLIHATDGAPRRHPHWKHYAQTRRAELLRAVAVAGISPDRCLEIGVPDQQAVHRLVELSCHLSRLFADLQPDVIFTHPFEGGHPDHDAVAFAVHHAAAGTRIIEFASYHRAAHSLTTGGNLETGCFLDSPNTETIRLDLDREQQSIKRRMLECFASQRKTLQWFRVDREVFRRAPAYDFTRPPHAGHLFYEAFDWGVEASEWLRLAQRAERTIGSCLSR